MTNITLRKTVKKSLPSVVEQSRYAVMKDFHDRLEHHKKAGTLGEPTLPNGQTVLTASQRECARVFKELRRFNRMHDDMLHFGLIEIEDAA